MFCHSNCQLNCSPCENEETHRLRGLRHAVVARVGAVVEDGRLLPVVVVGLQDEPGVRLLGAELPHVHRLRGRARDHAALRVLPSAEDEVDRSVQRRARQTLPSRAHIRKPALLKLEILYNYLLEQCGASNSHTWPASRCCPRRTWRGWRPRSTGSAPPSARVSGASSASPSRAPFGDPPPYRYSSVSWSSDWTLAANDHKRAHCSLESLNKRTCHIVWACDTYMYRLDGSEEARVAGILQCAIDRLAVLHELQVHSKWTQVLSDRPLVCLKVPPARALFTDKDWLFAFALTVFSRAF